jgi:hypothetical protein
MIHQIQGREGSAEREGEGEEVGGGEGEGGESNAYNFFLKYNRARFTH